MSISWLRLLRRRSAFQMRCPWRIGLLCVLFVCCVTLNAQAQFSRFQNYADEQGLGNLTVTALAQDKEGNLLLGTQGGLYRYDGSSLRQDAIGLPADWIVQLATDGVGRVWVVTSQNGIFVGDGSRFSRIETGVATAVINSPHLLATTGDGIVLNVNDTLLRAPAGPGGPGKFSPLFDAPTLAALPALAHARFVVSDAVGGLLIGCGDALCYAAEGHVKRFGAGDGLPADAWQVALRTADGTVWVRSLGHLAWRRPGQAVFNAVAVPGQHSTYFAVEPENLTLVADRGRGILTQGDEGLLDWDGSVWRSYAPHPGGLPAATMLSMLWDRKGSLWLGSQGYGAFRDLGLGVWEHWTQEDGLPSNIVWNMTRLSNGRFWVATDTGSVALGEKSSAIAGENFIAVASRAGRVWLAPSTGPLVRIDGDGRPAAHLPTIGPVGMAVVDRQNRLWLSTRTSLLMVPDADAEAAKVTAQLALPGRWCQTATTPADVIWAVCPEGLFRRGQNGTFERAVSPDLLRYQSATPSFYAEDELWIGTRTGGVARLHVTGAHMEALPPLVPPAISSKGIMFVQRDYRGWMWVGTDHGIDRFDGHSWRHFDSSDGLISNDLNQNSVFADTDGSMWFGTSHGLSHLINPDHLPPPTPLHPLITGLLLGSRTLPLSSSVRTRWSPEPLVVRFVDLDYAHDRGLMFRYRLRGLDTGWNTTTEHEIHYSAVPAGKFQFELIAVDIAHGTASTPIGFVIHIRAPWWRRWWFYGICVLTVSLLLVGTWKIRVRLLLIRTAEIGQARDLLQHQAVALQHQAIELQRLALWDTLTGLANRHAIMGTLEKAMRSAAAAPGRLAVLLCDIDHFKSINDTFGHLAGDEVLTAFGKRVGDAVSAPEAAGRYGGEEFLLILHGEPDAILRRVLAIQATISEAPYRFAGTDGAVTWSGGLAFLRASDTTLSLLGRADAALYRAKANGRNRIEDERSEPDADTKQPGVANHAAPDRPGTGEAGHGRRTADDCDPGSLSRQRCDLTRDLRAALENEEFVLHYQPIVNVDKDVVTACEALLRWQSPSRGIVSPGDFIPFAEEVGLMPEIGDWVLRAACRQAATWAAAVKVSVNLSPTQFRLPDLVERVAAALAEAGLPPERLELEVTETAIIDDVAAAAVMLQRLRALGITIALDDFGTGYSSLSFLSRLPFDRIKIDRCFVQDLGIKPEAAAIVRGLIVLCTGLGVATTAEGVESDRQIDLLRAEGCSEVQGFGIGRPRSASETQEWIAAFTASRTYEQAR